LLRKLLFVINWRC